MTTGVVPVFDPSTGASGGSSGGGGISLATPPADTDDTVAAGVSLSAHTFGAFSGAGAADIVSYTATNVQGAGTCTWSGTGLGPYTPTDADGDNGTLYLDAWDSAGGTGNRLGRAIHTYSRAAATGTEPVVASTLAATLSGADGYSYAPTLSLSAGDAGGTWSTTITRASDGASVSVTGSTTTTPTATLNVADTSAGDAFKCRSVYTDPSGFVGEFTTVYQVDGVSAASWQDIHSYVFSSNVTDLTLTKAAAAVYLYESDGTTPIIKLRFLDRSNTPVSTAVCTAASGKLLLTNQSNGGTEASYVWGEITEADTGIDWSSGKQYALDFVLSGLSWGSNADDCWIVFGTSQSGISSGNNVGIRLRRSLPTDYNQNGRRYFSGASNGVKTNSETSAPTSAVVRMIFDRARLVAIFWKTNTTTRLTGWPTVGVDGVFGSEMGTLAQPIESAPEIFGSTCYFYIDAQATSSSPGTIGVEAIYVQEYK